MKNKLIRHLISGYQEYSASTPPKCRYYPTCSHYAMGCYEKFNFFKATGLVIFRLLRCNPFTKGGYDPVPLTRKEKLTTQMQFLDLNEYNTKKTNK